MKLRTRLLLLLLALTAMPLSAVVYNVPTDQELVDRSALIVRGHVAGLTSRLNAAGQIETVITLDVDRTLKGEARRQVQFVQPGGEYQGRFAIIAGAPEYSAGEEVLLFLRRGAGQTLATDLGIGKFDVRMAADGTRFAVRDAADSPMLFNGRMIIDPNRKLDGFETAIAERVVTANELNTYEYATNIAPRFVEKTSSAKIAANDFPASAYTVTLGGSPARWSTATYTFKSNGTQPGISNPSSNASSAANAWNSASSNGSVNKINITVQSSGGSPRPWGTARDCTAGELSDSSVSCDDHINSITFGAASNTFPAESGIAAFSGIFGGNPGEIVGADIYVANQTFSATLFSQIMAHEIGHSLGFRHSNQGTPSDSNAIMNSSVGGQFGTALQCWDKDAVRIVYGGTSSCVAPDLTNGQPQNKTINSGQQTTLTVSSSTGCSLSYQWYVGTSGDTSQPISGATNAVFTTPALNNTTKYWVAVSNACGTVNSTTATVTVNPAPGCVGVTSVTQPADQTIVQGSQATFSISYNPSSATSPVFISWYRNGNAISGATSSSFTTDIAGTYFVRVGNACSSVDTKTFTLTVTTACVAPTVKTQPSSKSVTTTDPVTLTAEFNGTTPLTYQWYEGQSGDTSKPVSGATDSSFTTGAITSTVSYWVQAKNACGQANSSTATITFTAPCGTPGKFNVAGPGTVLTGVGYSIVWDAVPGASAYELQEAESPDFIGATNRTLTTNHFETSKNVTAAKKFYYRARATAGCNGTVGPFGTATEVVVVLPPSVNDLNPTVSVPYGSTAPIVLNYFVAAPPNAKTALDNSFSAGSDKSWVSVTPASGTIPPGGVNLAVQINPSTLPAGTNTATVSVTSASGAPIATVPVGVNLVTPVSPNPKPSGAAVSKGLIIPVVGRASGSNNSLFVSDVRLLNSTSKTMKYVMTYTPSGTNGLNNGKQMTVDIAPGETKAFNDIVKNFFGLGNTGDTAIGMLDVRSLSNDALDPKTTFASSRTYNLTSTGTFGQFIPALSSPSFVSKGQKLSLQQIAESEQYRTNVGFVEGSGNFVTAVARVFDANGVKLKEVAINLEPYQQVQYNRFLSQNAGISSLADGRIEVEVTSDLGSISAYASVVDNRTNDPLLVSPVVVGATNTTKYVIPGIADLTNSNANWRSDIRVFNSSNSTQSATLTYYPQGGGTPMSKQVNIAPNSILAVDGVLQTYFGVTNSGGALHISTASASPLVASARTYDAKLSPDGKPLTYGQFIPAVTAADAVGAGDRALELLQVEESASFRSNLALTEVTGKPVLVRLTAYAPDALAAPFKDVFVDANGFIQLNQVLKQMNFSTTYNARVNVKVVGGEGKVAAYASVVDNKTQDPTYIPAQ